MLVRIVALLLALTPSLVSAAPLRVGSDVSYAPLEFYASGSKQAQGFDFDLAAALAAQIGAPIAFRNDAFNDLIPSVNGGKFDFVISAISDTRARSKKSISWITFWPAAECWSLLAIRATSST